MNRAQELMKAMVDAYEKSPSCNLPVAVLLAAVDRLKLGWEPGYPSQGPYVTFSGMPFYLVPGLARSAILYADGTTSPA